jgi:hypothetical protein
MTEEPTAAPVTTPVSDPTPATEGALLVQTPPGVELDNVIEAPAHTEDGPEVAPTEGFTVISVLTAQPAALV